MKDGQGGGVGGRIKSLKAVCQSSHGGRDDAPAGGQRVRDWGRDGERERGERQETILLAPSGPAVSSQIYRLGVRRGAKGGGVRWLLVGTKVSDTGYRATTKSSVLASEVVRDGARGGIGEWGGGWNGGRGAGCCVEGEEPQRAAADKTPNKSGRDAVRADVVMSVACSIGLMVMYSVMALQVTPQSEEVPRTAQERYMPTVLRAGGACLVQTSCAGDGDLKRRTEQLEPRWRLVWWL